jgi:hypothetical protein
MARAPTGGRAPTAHLDEFTATQLLIAVTPRRNGRPEPQADELRLLRAQHNLAERRLRVPRGDNCPMPGGRTVVRRKASSDY